MPCTITQTGRRWHVDEHNVYDRLNWLIAANRDEAYRVGALLAIPVGVLAFILFTLLHRLVARGGMIDARHFWPLACGVAAFIAAFILGR